jgi:hypothetical protein
VVPLSARARTEPSWKPLVLKKVFPVGLCAPWAQLAYVPIGKVLTLRPFAGVVPLSDRPRPCKLVAQKARSVKKDVLMFIAANSNGFSSSGRRNSQRPLSGSFNYPYLRILPHEEPHNEDDRRQQQ